MTSMQIMTSPVVEKSENISIINYRKKMLEHFLLDIIEIITFAEHGTIKMDCVRTV